MANEILEILLTDRPIRAPEVDLREDAGAVLDFLGVVRGREKQEPIQGIDYEIYSSMAQKQLHRICLEGMSRFGLKVIRLIHRHGWVPVGAASLFLRVAAPHRAPALAGLEWIIVRLKEEVPIWKHPRSH